MSQRVREELLPRWRQRYANRGREGKSRLIDELVEDFGYSRKHAIKLLNARAGWGGQAGVPRGRPPLYGPEVVKVLKAVWKAAEQPCGKRMAALLSEWLPFYEQEHGKLTQKLRKDVLGISPAQIDRLLKPFRGGPGGRGRCGTKPGTLLKNKIPIRTDNWDIDRPGYLEADTVAHCGTSLEGDFIWSVTYTDIYSGWTANRAVFNKGSTGIVAATQEVEAALPFKVLGFDCDNGSEFLNHHLVSYFTERPKRVKFTRSRPYHKNDNGHVEQKNWTHVRQLLGYQRMEDPELVERINEVYREYWEPLHNYFLPSTKLVEKSRTGAKIKRQHDTPQTPVARLLKSSKLTREAKARLRGEKKKHNPFKLQRDLEQRLRAILLPGLRSSRPTGSLRSAQAKSKKNQTKTTVS